MFCFVISESACVNAKIDRTGRSESSLRPREGAWSYSQVCRIHSAIPSSGIMTKSRLHLAGPTSTKTGISIHLFASQHVEGGFGQMPRHRSNRFGMPFLLAQPPV